MNQARTLILAVATAGLILGLTRLPVPADFNWSAETVRLFDRLSTTHQRQVAAGMIFVQSSVLSDDQHLVGFGRLAQADERFAMGLSVIATLPKAGPDALKLVAVTQELSRLERGLERQTIDPSYAVERWAQLLPEQATLVCNVRSDLGLPPLSDRVFW